MKSASSWRPWSRWSSSCLARNCGCCCEATRCCSSGRVLPSRARSAQQAGALSHDMRPMAGSQAWQMHTVLSQEDLPWEVNCYGALNSLSPAIPGARRSEPERPDVEACPALRS